MTDDEIVREAESAACDLVPARCAAVRAACALITEPRLGYQNAETRDAYVEALYLAGVVPMLDDGTYDISDAKLTQAYQAASFQSSCGITTERIWRDIGVDDPRLFMWYPDRASRGGSYYAVALEMEIAKQAGAWVSGIPWEPGTPLPEPGDALIIGLMSDPSFTRGGGFAGEHELTVIARDGMLIHSVDGGQPHIDVRTRMLVEVGRELWCGQVDRATGECPLGADGRPLQGRRVVGFTDITRLPLSAEPSCCSSGASRIVRTTAGKVALAAATAAAVLAALYIWKGRKR